MYTANSIGDLIEVGKKRTAGDGSNNIDGDSGNAVAVASASASASASATKKRDLDSCVDTGTTQK